MTPSEMKALIDDLYLLSATDIDEAHRLYLHEEFSIEEADELPVAGTYHGSQGLKDLYGKVFTMFDIADLERTCFMTGEDCCANKVVFKLTDPTLDSIELLEFFRFKDGKVVEIRPYYFSPGQFIRAAEAKK